MKLKVPYHSQYIDISDPYWMLRSCGLLSLWQVLEFHGLIARFDPNKFISDANIAKSTDGYHFENGWVHDYLVSKAVEYGALHSYRKEGVIDFSEIESLIVKGLPVIVSVSKLVLEQKRFHLITLVGCDIIDNTKYVYYHDTESTDKERGAFRCCSVDTFMNFFRGKIIIVQK